MDEARSGNAMLIYIVGGLALLGIVAATWMRAPTAAPESVATEPVATVTKPDLHVLQQVPGGALAGGDVILITLDTTRRDHLGCYGFAAARTPVIDALAARSVVFDHAITGVPSTLPSHSSMLTGLEVPVHGVRTNGKYTLSEQHLTLTEILSERGYATAGFVATFVLNRKFGLMQGFDHYDDKVEKKRPASEMTDVAIAWLRAQRAAHPEQPVFMWVHYFDPHKPYDPPPEFMEMFPDSPYDGEIAFVDQEMKRLLAAFDELGVTENGLILLAADHGEGLGEHLEETHSRLIYDTTMRIPMFITLPARFNAVGRVDDITVGTIDIMPTALSLLGIDGPEMNGLDLRTADVPRERLMYIETLSPLMYSGWSPLHGLRGVDRKFILAPDAEYYDLATDPNELVNLFEDDPTVASDLVVELGTRMKDWKAPEDLFRAVAMLDEDTASKLAALGYVSTIEDGRVPREKLDPKDALPLFYVLKSNAGKMNLAALELLAVPPVDGRAYKRALLLAREASALQPQSPVMRLTLGMALYRTGQHDEAMRELAQIDRDDYPLGQVYVAMCLHHQKRDVFARQLLGDIEGQLSAEHEAVVAEAWSLVGRP